MLYTHRVHNYPEEPPKINWGFYKSRITLTGLVDKFEKQVCVLKSGSSKNGFMGCRNKIGIYCKFVCTNCVKY